MNWTVMTTIGLDAGTLVYATQQGMDALAAVNADPMANEGERAQRTFTIIAGLIAQGSMLILSNKDLFQGGLKRSDFFPTDTEATLAGAKGVANPELEMGARLDIALALKQAGDPAAALAANKLSNRDLIDRYHTLGWLKSGLNDTEIAALLPRFSTNTLVALRDLEPRGVKTLVERVGSDAVVEAMAPRLKGSGLNEMLNATSPEKLRRLHATFGDEGLESLVNEVTAPNIGRLLNGMTPAELHTRAGELGHSALKNYGAEITGSDLSALIQSRGVALVKWAGGDQGGSAASSLLKRLSLQALEGLSGAKSPGTGVSGARATALVNQLSAPLVNRAAPKVSGKDLATFADTFTAEAPGLVENRISRGETEIGKGKATKHFDKLSQGAESLRAAHEPAPIGTGELVSPAPLTADSIILDTNYYRNLSYALKKMAKVPPEKLYPSEQAVYSDWTARNSAGPVDVRTGAVTIAETPSDPAIGRKGFEPVISRSDPTYRTAVSELEAKEVGDKGPLGAPDRTMIADALFSVPKGCSKPPLVLTSDKELCKSLARDFATDPAVRRLPGGYPGLVALPDVFTIQIPGAPGWQLRIKPL